jgi:hypothetical protein
LDVGLFGTASILWLALLGMKRRKLLGLWPFLALLPLYYLLTSAAAWMAIFTILFYGPIIGIRPSMASPKLRGKACLCSL